MVDTAARETRTLLEVLQAVVGGDPLAIESLLTIEHSSLVQAQVVGEPLVLVRLAVGSVLQGLLEHKWSPQQVQSWASFVRRGYVSGTARGAISALDLAYEPGHEESIADAVSRLDELGETVDGEVTPDEIRDLLRRLEGT